LITDLAEIFSSSLATALRFYDTDFATFDCYYGADISDLSIERYSRA
jgi:hypothetical protein